MAIIDKYLNKTSCYCDRCGVKNTQKRLLSMQCDAISMNRAIIICGDCLSELAKFVGATVNFPLANEWIASSIDYRAHVIAYDGNDAFSQRMEEMKEHFDAAREAFEKHKIIKGTYLQKALKIFDHFYGEWQSR